MMMMIVVVVVVVNKSFRSQFQVNYLSKRIIG